MVLIHIRGRVMSDELAKIVVFKRKDIRKIFHHSEWWFVIIDVVSALTDSDNPAQYLKNIRNRDLELSQLMDPVNKGGGSN